MPTLTGLIGPWGPTVDIKVMQTNQRVEALKRAGKAFSSPVIVLGLIDTGASLSILDTTVTHSLGLEPRGVVSIHTPSTGAASAKHMSYDALFIIGETTGEPLSKTVQVVESDSPVFSSLKPAYSSSSTAQKSRQLDASLAGYRRD